MMKLKIFPALITLLLGSFLLAPASADSRWSRDDTREKRYEEHRHEHKSGRKEHKQKKDHRIGTQRSKTKNLNPGQHKRDLKEHRRDEKKYKRTDRLYSTKRLYPRDKHKTRHSTYRDHDYRDYRKDKHYDGRHDYKDRYRKNRRYEIRHGNRLLFSTPRHRTYRNIIVGRPFGHSYYGYGHFHNDHNAWRWLTFSAITLKLLDMVDEQAQREHEAAQIEATTADVGERIYWDTDEASGYVVTTREGTSSRGLPCREYQQSITVGGKTEEAYGNACLQQDGAWKIVD